MSRALQEVEQVNAALTTRLQHWRDVLAAAAEHGQGLYVTF